MPVLLMHSDRRAKTAVTLSMFDFSDTRGDTNASSNVLRKGR